MTTLGPGARDFLDAVGLVLAFEGAIYAAAPRAMKSVLSKMRDVSDDALRWGGLAFLIAGVALVWWIRG